MTSINEFVFHFLSMLGNTGQVMVQLELLLFANILEDYLHFHISLYMVYTVHFIMAPGLERLLCTSENGRASNEYTVLIESNATNKMTRRKGNESEMYRRK